MRKEAKMERCDTQQISHIQILLCLIDLALLGTLLLPLNVWSQGRGGVLRIGMTAADIPYTGGIPDQGVEGYRFIGFPLYDALINWDLSHGERLRSPGPRLAGAGGGHPPAPTKGDFTLGR